MNEDSLTGLLVILALIVIQAFVSLIHAAIANIRTGNMRSLATEGHKNALQVLTLNASTNLTISFQLITALLYFAIAGVTVRNLIEPMIPANGSGTGAIYAVWLIAVACVTLVLGNIVPEAVGSTYADSLALLFGRVMAAVVFVLRPVIFILLRASSLLSSFFGSTGLVNTITEEEIMTLVEEGHTGGTIEDEEKNMIYSVLRLDQTKTSEVMIPRIDMVAIDIALTPEQAVEVFIETGYSRIPVYEDNIDNIQGVLYAKDLMAYWRNRTEAKTIRELMRSAYFVPETKPADDLLREIQLQRVHMAIVQDEYGGTAGLVTIENIIEEIIGDIQDEYDLEEAEYEPIGTDEYMVDASIDLDHFNDLLDVELTAEDSDTLAGYLYTYFERVPHVGETVELDNLSLNVVSIEGRRIRKVHAVRKRPAAEENEQIKDDNSKDQRQEITEAGR